MKTQIKQYLLAKIAEKKFRNRTMFVFIMRGLLEMTAVEHSQASLMLQTYTPAEPSCAEILLNTSATDRFILKTCLIIM